MTSTFDTLYKLTKKDMFPAGISMANAFQDDPMWNAVLNSDSSKLPHSLEMSIRHCWKYGSVYATSEKLEGLMAIVPGKQGDMTMWRMLRSGSFPVAAKLGKDIGFKLGRCFEPLVKDRNEEMKGREYIYLFLLGVQKELQGQGMGSTLLRLLISDCDEKRVPIYLETETGQNAQMYEHFGFKTVKQFSLPEVNHPMWEMVREPQ